MDISDAKAPTISILLPVLNSAKFLRETLETVVSQTFKDWELISMDGGSRDGSLEILHEYAKKYRGIRIFSGPDEGGFHAIDKAAHEACGEFIMLLCASDGYLDREWLEKCVGVMRNDPEVSLVWGIPFDMTEGGKLVGPHYVFAHFLQDKQSFKKTSVMKKIFGKIDLRRPASLLEFVRKINPANVVSMRHMLRSGAPPQKQDWFLYWLRTGTVFPDGNMLMSRKVFLECFPRYRMGTREAGDFGQFYFDFNARGYLAYCIPSPANFGRTHQGQVGERERKYNDHVTRTYMQRVKQFRNKISHADHRMIFLDRTGRAIA